MCARQYGLPDERLQPLQVGPLTLPRVREMHGQLSSPGRPAATLRPFPVRGVQQRLVRGHHPLVPAVLEHRTPSGRRHADQLRNLAQIQGDPAHLHGGDQVVRLARGHALGGQDRKQLHPGVDGRRLVLAPPPYGIAAQLPVRRRRVLRLGHRSSSGVVTARP
ncbi:hypothetical protein O1L68_40035 [Streptomyces lydicus]|nr:hypothetical protein [Streptomyces lydicus]